EMSLSRHQHAREARESGMWMSALAESMTEAVLICDAKGYVKFINPAAEALIGRRLQEVQEMRMCDVVSLLDTETRAPLPFPVTEPLLEGRSTMRGNCSLRVGEDREYPVEFTASPLRSPEGTLFGILYVLRRTSEREMIHGRVLRELDALSRLQKRSLPSGEAAIPGVSLQWFLLPAQFGGGDALGCMPLDNGHVGFYSLTVPGGGLLSAMFSLLLGMFLTPSFDRGGILVENLCSEPGQRILAPAEVAQLLEKRFFLKDETAPYFTLVYGVLENATGKVTLVRAGHQAPLFQNADGIVRMVRPEGQAIGQAAGAAVKAETIHLDRTDRLFLFSDGLAACQNRSGQQFSAERLMQSISASRRKSLRDAVADIREGIVQWRAGEPFAADASILALERE
ncbi:MAG TPA: SpoIIE family protein phosphatase, partial [Spirochaetia bacterium]|nr:SpoIIE family protein phosphatase [Spirochaetia bacterium]